MTDIPNTSDFMHTFRNQFRRPVLIKHVSKIGVFDAIDLRTNAIWRDNTIDMSLDGLLTRLTKDINSRPNHTLYYRNISIWETMGENYTPSGGYRTYARFWDIRLYYPGVFGPKFEALADVHGMGMG